jgi:hypothetical protein
MTKTLRRIAPVAVLTLALIGSAHSGDLIEAAKSTTARVEKTIVGVRVVIRLKFGGGQDQEEKLEVVGTVIDPTGLTVADATSVDPTGMIRALSGNKGIEADVKETTLIMDDGTEVEADMVLRDSDLGLAFIRPRDTSKKFAAVELKERAKAPELLEGVFVVARGGKLANRAPLVKVGRIESIVKGPRTFYTSDGELSSQSGCMVYGADGEALGLIVIRYQQQAEGGGNLQRMLGGGDSAIRIIRPVNDILEIAAQAKTAKVPEKKPDEKKEEKEVKADKLIEPAPTPDMPKTEDK